MATLKAKTSITTTATAAKNRRIEDLEMTIDSLTEGALPYFRSIFKQLALANPENAKILCEFLTAEYNECNIKLSSRLTKIKIIYLFNKHLDFKPFEQITKQDILEYLGTLRKTESQDNTHKWIGTYNTRQMVINKFFKWLYNN
jgi:hypothetical protein